MIATKTRPIPNPTQPAPQLVAEADRPVALVVEDDPDTRQYIATLLEHDGWTVRTASTGERAVLMVREHIPEIILLDLALPAMSGLDVLRTLKDNSRIKIEKTP